MQVQVTTPFVQQSQAATQVILAPYAFYQGIKRFLSTFGIYFLAVVSIPILPLGLIYLWIIMFRIRLGLAKAIRSNVDITIMNYSQIRREYDALQIIQQKIVNSGIDNLTGFGSLVINIFQIRAIVKIFRRRIFDLEESLHSMDPKATALDGFLIPVKEDELWRNRTKAYDYLM